MPATATRGRDRSLWPAFRWQLLHDILPGANCGASCGVSVKMRKPHRISFDRVDLSSDGLVNGSLGKNHAVTIVVREETSGPLITYWRGRDAAGSGMLEHADNPIQAASVRPSA